MNDDHFFRGKFFEELDARFTKIDEQVKETNKKVDELLAVKYWALGVVAAVSFLMNYGWTVIRDKFLGHS